jgi:PAS domain S-box-containing protein
MNQVTEEPSWRSLEVEEGTTAVIDRGVHDEAWSELDGARYRKAVRNILAENARLRSVLGHCPKGIAVLDEHGNLRGYNREFTELLGGKPKLGDQVFDLFEPTDRELLRAVIQRAGTTKKAAAVVRIEPNGHGAREIEFLAATLPSSTDRSIGVVLAGEDRTNTVDDELARISLDDANRRDAFALATMVARTHADQLRLQAVEALQAKKSDPDVARALCALHAQAALLTTVPDRISLRPEGASDLAAAANRAARLAWIGRARRRVTVDVQIESGIRVAMTEGDLVQVLTNVLTNCMQGIEDAERFGWITMTADVNTDKRVTELSIRDNGRGMTPHALQQCFEGALTEDGPGLGLAIARTIVEARGGAIRALSEPDRGTTVVLTLPTS